MYSRSKYFVLTIDYLIPFIVLLTIMVGYFLAFHTPFFTIQNIHCNLDYESCKNSNVLSELDKYRGESLFVVDIDVIQSRLLSGEYTIRSAEISRSLPNTLEVELLSTYPVIALQLSDNQDQWIAVDQRMRAISVLSVDPNVPTLTLDSIPPFHLGQAIEDSSVTDALQLALRITQDLPSVLTIHLDQESTVTLELSSGVIALLTTTRDQSDQIKTLQSILATSEISGSYKLIDVRFSRPVLK